MSVAPANTLVFSYRRFSSGRQASGHSLERQTESARRWCHEKGYRLDEDLALADLGVSAYSGDNASRGALSGFLGAIESGRIPKDSILLVESLDRLSRAAIPEAVGLLTSIVRAGVRVVSLIDGHEWNQKTIEDTTSFLLSVLLFSRAHEESSTKAKRVSEQFQKKRKAGLPVVSFGHGPGWASPKPDRSGWDVDADRAAVVVRVFELAAAGHGGIAISRQANQEGWLLPWRVRSNTASRWEHTGVSRLLRDRRVLGEWQPKRMVGGKLKPDGDPVANYYPRVVQDALWYQVQTALGGRAGPLRIRGLKADVFSGLFYCSCGERMDRKAPTGRGYPRYYCLGRKNGASKCEGVSEAVLLGPVLSAIAQLEQAAFHPDTAAERAREELAIAEAKLRDIDAGASRILDAIQDGGSSSLLSGRLNALESEKIETEAVIARARAELGAAPTLDANFGRRLAESASAVVADKADVEGRHRVAQALWQVVQRIVWNGRFFMVHARSGAAFGVNPPAVALRRAKNRNAGQPRRSTGPGAAKAKGA
jgi:DNA invertase Pin-like site-specific DNA recombinase